MNILILNWRDVRHVWAGGSELYIHELAKRWAKSHNVTLFCAQDPDKSLKDEEIIDGVRIIRRGGRYSVYLFAIYYYFRFFRKTIDFVVDVENGIPFFTPLYIRKKKLSIVYHVHGMQFFYELTFPFNVIGYCLEKYFFPFLYRSVEIMAISKTTRRELVRIGFKKEKIHLVFPGIGNVRKASNEKYKKPTILYLGRIKKYKRVNMLVDVFRKVHKINPRVRLVIAGWGSEAPFISDFVMKNKLRKSIDIIGPVNEHEKAELYAKSWIFVNPSLHEGWGISVIEANAYKTPAIGFKVPGLSDSIVDGKTGYLCSNEEDMINKILYIIENNKIREELSYDAFLWSKKFDWNVSAKKGQRLIEKIASKK